MLITIGVSWALLSWAHQQNPAANSGITWTLLAVFVFYGFVYTPIVSYISARLEGIIGQTVQIPFVREATFILTGYQGVAMSRRSGDELPVLDPMGLVGLDAEAFAAIGLVRIGLGSTAGSATTTS